MEILTRSPQPIHRPCWELSDRNTPAVRWVDEHIGIPLWSKQIEVLNAVFTQGSVTVRSGHGIGKTLIAAVITLCFIDTLRPSKVITTAPTWRQVAHILWAEINTLYRKSKIPQLIGGRMLNMSYWLSDEHFAVGFHPRENRLEEFQGYHSPNILIIMDESPGISQVLYDAAMGLMTTNAYILQIGNPTEPAGHFWGSFQDDAYHKVHVSCFDSPNVTGEAHIPGLVTREWIEARRNDWGEDDPRYRNKVLGEFSDTTEDRGIPMDWIRAAFA